MRETDSVDDVQDALLDALLDAVGDAVLHVDRTWKVLLANRAAERLLARSRGDLIGHDVAALLPLVDAEDRRVSIPDSRSEQRRTRAGLFLVRSHGPRVPVAVTSSPVVRDDRFRGSLIAVRDLSDIARTEEKLEETKQAMNAARQAEREKSALLANLGHEIREPMNGVIGMADLLLQTQLTGEQREYASTVRRSADTLLAILNDILDFSRIEAGTLEIEPLPFDLRRSVEEVAEQLAPAAEEKDLELIVRYDPEAPRHLVGDPGRIRQVVMNLLGNAIKFTREGHVLVEVDALEVSETQARLKIAVHDTGIGISQGILRNLFRKSPQGDGFATRRFGGTGLGLAICKQLVEMMGGTIGVHSVLDEGSTFWFELKLRINRSAPAPLHAEDLTGLRVLVIDSSETGRRILLEQLEHWGLRAEGFGTGAKALRRLREAKAEGDPFRIAILSSQLRGMDAEALGDLVKSDPELRETDLVLVSPIGAQGDAKRLDRIGFSGYLVKPIRELALKDTLEVVWGARKHGVDQTLVTRHLLSDSKILKGPVLASEPEADAAEREPRGRVLLAADNGLNQRVARAILEGLGYEVEAAPSGQAALDAHERSDYDALFLDCRMPGLGAVEATAVVRAREEEGRKRTPVIALVAPGADDDHERCLEAGMDDSVTKPFGREELRRILERWVEERDPDPARSGTRTVG